MAGRAKLGWASRRGARQGGGDAAALGKARVCARWVLVGHEHECEPFAKPFAKPLAKHFTKLAHANQARAQKTLDSTSPHP